MAKTCFYCDKGVRIGRTVSHSHNVNPRPFGANLQRVRALIDGSVRRIWVCTRCLRSGEVVKAPARNWQPAEQE